MNRAEAAALIESTMDDGALDWERTGESSFVVTLPGTHKLRTLCNLVVGDHSVRIEAFVMRQPDENRQELWTWLLQRNARLYGVAFSIDTVGDPRGDRSAARRGAHVRRRFLRHDVGDRIRIGHPAGMGLARVTG